MSLWEKLFAISENIDSNLYPKVEKVINYVGSYIQLNMKELAKTMIFIGILIPVLVSIFIDKKYFDALIISFLYTWLSWPWLSEVRNYKELDSITLEEYRCRLSSAFCIPTSFIVTPLFFIFPIIHDHHQIIEMAKGTTINVIFYFLIYVAMVIISMNPPKKTKKFEFNFSFNLIPEGV